MPWHFFVGICQAEVQEERRQACRAMGAGEVGGWAGGGSMGGFAADARRRRQEPPPLAYIAPACALTGAHPLATHAAKKNSEMVHCVV
jgi:hypothetical protein